MVYEEGNCSIFDNMFDGITQDIIGEHIVSIMNFYFDTELFIMAIVVMVPFTMMMAISVMVVSFTVVVIAKTFSGLKCSYDILLNGIIDSPAYTGIYLYIKGC